MSVQPKASAPQASHAAAPEKEVKHTAGFLDKVKYVFADMLPESLYSYLELDKKIEKNWKVSPESMRFRNTEALKAVGGKNLSPKVRNAIRITALVLTIAIISLAHTFPPILFLGAAIALMLAFSESGLLATIKVFKILLMLTTTTIGILCLPFVGVLAPSLALIGLVTPILYATNMAILMRNPPRSKDEDVGDAYGIMEEYAKITEHRGGNPTLHCGSQMHHEAAQSQHRQLVKIDQEFQAKERAAKAAAAAQSPVPSAPPLPQSELASLAQPDSTVTPNAAPVSGLKPKPRRESRPPPPKYRNPQRNTKPNSRQSQNTLSGSN